MRHTVASHETILTESPAVNWDGLQLAMARAGADAVVATTPANVTYVSDFWSLSHWTRQSAQVFAIALRDGSRNVTVVLPLGNADLLSVDVPSAPQRAVAYGSFSVAAGVPAPQDSSEGRDLLELARGTADRSSIQTLIETLRSQLGSTASIAVETDGLLDGDLETMKAELTGCRITSATALLRQARSIKTDVEIGRLRLAADLSQRGFVHALGCVSQGASELDVQRELLSFFVKNDALPFLTSIQSGSRTALPNGQATHRRIAAGDLLRFDGGCRYQHYVADIARIAIAGEPTKKQAAYYHAVHSGLEAAVAIAKPGVTGKQIFAAAVTAVRDNGIAHYERSHCGHGIGVENYDFPRITADSTDVLQPGMVICLETPYYELGWGGVQAEDTFAVTAFGLDRFTTIPATLMTVS